MGKYNIVHVSLFPTNEFYNDLCQITKSIGTNIKAASQEWKQGNIRLPNNLYIELSYFPYLDKEINKSEHTRNCFLTDADSIGIYRELNKNSGRECN